MSASPFEGRRLHFVGIGGAGMSGLALVADVLGAEVIEETVEWRHRPTEPIDPETGQGFAHVQYAFSAHRAVVDVDVELGLIKVVELACTQDVGKAINPEAVIGQIQGGTAQGLGLAVMEEIQVRNGEIRNPSFTDYLIPTILDMPPVVSELVEEPEPGSPFGVKGVGEPSTIVAPAAIAAALRRGDGREGGVLCVASATSASSLRTALAADGFDLRMWDNGS
jgi:CO/xanthine dehydrogenase Mo-binding subunit